MAEKETRRGPPFEKPTKKEKERKEIYIGIAYEL